MIFRDKARCCSSDESCCETIETPSEQDEETDQKGGFYMSFSKASDEIEAKNVGVVVAVALGLAVAAAAYLIVKPCLFKKFSSKR